MREYLQKNFLSLFLGFVFGASFFVLFYIFNTENIFASLSIPYKSTEAGLEVEIGNSEIVSEDTSDAGAKKIVKILSGLFFILKALLGGVVVFWIVWSGVYIVAGSTDEEQVKKGKQMLKFSIFGLVAMLFAEPFVLDIFYGGGDMQTEKTGIGDINHSVENLRSQIKGVMDFIKTVLIFVAMGYIIKAGSQMIFSYGDDEEISKAKSIFIPMVFGFLIILFNEIFIDKVLYHTVLSSSGSGDILDQGTVTFNSADASGVSIFVKEIVGFLKYVLGVIGVVIFGFIVYGGFIVMTSMGDDEKAGNGKKILTNSIIGMIIVLVSFVLMMSLVNFEV